MRRLLLALLLGVGLLTSSACHPGPLQRGQHFACAAYVGNECDLP
jgi:hypothetical protein